MIQSTWSSGSHSHCTKLWLYCSQKTGSRSHCSKLWLHCSKKKHNFNTYHKKNSAQLQITKKLQLFEVTSIFYPYFSIIDDIPRLFYSEFFQFSIFLDPAPWKSLDFVGKISKLWCDLSRRRSNLFVFGQKFLEATIFLYKFWDL